MTEGSVSTPAGGCLGPSWSQWQGLGLEKALKKGLLGSVFPKTKPAEALPMSQQNFPSIVSFDRHYLIILSAPLSRQRHRGPEKGHHVIKLVSPRLNI